MNEKKSTVPTMITNQCKTRKLAVVLYHRFVKAMSASYDFDGLTLMRAKSRLLVKDENNENKNDHPDSYPRRLYRPALA